MIINQGLIYELLKSKLNDYGANLIIDRLNDNGYKAYFVGGCVRDCILNKKIYDYDITTNAKPCDIKNIFNDLNIILKGEKFFSVTIIVGDKSYEVTSFRQDVNYYDNRHSQVSFVDDIYLDLSRRDFTINTLAFNKNQGLINNYNGFYDTRNRIISTVINADLSFKQDSLRILRALRFSSTLNFIIDEKTTSAIKNDYNLIDNLSNDRIFEELKKLLVGINAYDVFNKFDYVFKKIINKFVVFNSECSNVYNLFLNVFQNSPCDYYVRLTIILFFIKKSCKNFDLKGFISLFNDKKQVKNLMILSTFDYKNIDFCNKNQVKKLLTNNDKSVIYLISKIKDCFCDIVDNNQTNYRKCKNTIKQITVNKECYNLKNLCVNGNDLIALGFKGKNIKLLLNEILDKVIDGILINEKTILLDFATNYGKLYGK